MNHAGMPVRHHELLQAGAGPGLRGEVEYLRTFVRQLRRKIEDIPAKPRYLATEAFIGYRFRSAMSDTGNRIATPRSARQRKFRIGTRCGIRTLNLESSSVFRRDVRFVFTVRRNRWYGRSLTRNANTPDARGYPR